MAKKRLQMQRKVSQSKPKRSPERTRHNLQRLISRQNFGSVEEVNAFMSDLMAKTGGLIPDVPPITPAEEAEDLLLQAAEMPLSQGRKALVERAVQLNPDSIEAHLRLAFTTTDIEESRRTLRQAVVIGERVLHRELSERQHASASSDMRFYLEARHALAIIANQQGDYAEARTNLRELLLLDEEDHIVVCLLACVLLNMGDDAGYAELRQQFADEQAIWWSFGDALLAYRQHGRGPVADAVMEQALRTYPIFILVIMNLVLNEPLPRSVEASQAYEDCRAFVVCAKPSLDHDEIVEWYMSIADNIINEAGSRPRSRKKRR